MDGERINSSKEKSEAKKTRNDTLNEKKLRKLALDTIISMVKDDELKPSDRLSAVKALLDYIKAQPERVNDDTLRVIFENMPEGFAD